MMASWTEKELEDWLWEHPEVLGLDGYRHCGRQIRLPNGMVADIIGQTDDDELVVTELKAAKANGEALSQLLAYMQLLRLTMYTRARVDLPADSPPEATQWWQGWRQKVLNVRGVLVAPDFDDYTLLAISGHALLQARFVSLAWESYSPGRNWPIAQAKGDLPEELDIIIHDLLEAYALPYANDARGSVFQLLAAKEAVPDDVMAAAIEAEHNSISGKGEDAEAVPDAVG